MLRRGAILSAVGIIIASVFSFGAIEFFVNVVLGRNVLYDPIDMIGMIGPMGLLLGLVSYASYQATNRYTSKLLNAIETVAAGSFEVRLEDVGSGLYHEVFANFNAMCEELRSIQTLRDDFINHFSHEFKTPITSINGFARLLLEEKVSEEERVQYLQIIAAESDRLAGMATSALLMTKLDSQQFIADKAPYSLDEQIKRCAILLSPQWTAKGIDLSAELESATFLGSADLMQHVWINIIGNAVKFTPQGGKITLALKREADWAVAEIADTGKGMAKEELERAFEKYYQGDGSRSSKGLGLGLAIARRVVSLSGGRLEAQSRLGEGSRFIVSLPLRANS